MLLSITGKAGLFHPEANVKPLQNDVEDTVTRGIDDSRTTDVSNTMDTNDLTTEQGSNLVGQNSLMIQMPRTEVPEILSPISDDYNGRTVILGPMATGRDITRSPPSRVKIAQAQHHHSYTGRASRFTLTQHQKFLKYLRLSLGKQSSH